MKVWNMTSTFGAYGFNKSHSVSYAMIAYWQMYLKVHHPIEFYYASLATAQDAEKRDMFINEAKRKGVPFLPLHPNRSSKTFSLESGGIRYGLMQVHGIGGKTADLLIEARPLAGWEDVLAIKGIGVKTVELFKEYIERGDDLFQLEPMKKHLEKLRERVSAIGLVELLALADHEPVDTRREHLVAGFVVSRNYRQEEKLSVQARDASKAGAKSSTVILYIRDESGESFPVVVPGKVAIPKTREIWEGKAGDVYLLRGRLPEHGKFYLCNGIANTAIQDDRRSDNETSEASQLRLTI